MYGFWPLIRAKEALGKAVDSEDAGRIETEYQNYQNLYQQYESLMKLSQNGAKVFSGNINSTRPAGNMMPDAFVSDYAGHNKVNGLFLLHGVSKNLGVTPKQLVSNPVATMVKGAKDYSKKYGLSGSRPPCSRKRISTFRTWRRSSPAISGRIILFPRKI